MEQRSGILEHDARLLAFVDKLGNELTHPLVAPHEHRSVVVVANVLMIHHVLEVANDLGATEVATSGGNQRLMHMQCNGRRAPDAAEVDPAVGKIPLLL